MTTESISIHSAPADRTAIRLDFERNADRWAHRWSCCGQSQPAVWLQSVEGTMDQIWPASPPLQDINQLPIGPDDAVLGVGMAGRSHWSASYSLEQRPAARCCIKADLACLVKMDDSDRLENPIAPPVQLGSTYELGEGCQIRSVHQSKIEITTPTNQRVVLEAIEDEESATVLRVNHSTLSIAPGRISKSPVRATRWAFRVFVAD